MVSFIVFIQEIELKLSPYRLMHLRQLLRLDKCFLWLWVWWRTDRITRKLLDNFRRNAISAHPNLDKWGHRQLVQTVSRVSSRHSFLKLLWFLCTKHKVMSESDSISLYDANSQRRNNRLLKHFCDRKNNDSVQKWRYVLIFVCYLEEILFLQDYCHVFVVQKVEVVLTFKFKWLSLIFWLFSLWLNKLVKIWLLRVFLHKFIEWTKWQRLLDWALRGLVVRRLWFTAVTWFRFLFWWWLLDWQYFGFDLFHLLKHRSGSFFFCLFFLRLDKLFLLLFDISFLCQIIENTFCECLGSGKNHF